MGLFLLLGGLLLMGLVVPQRSLLAPAGLYEAWKAKSPALVGVLEVLGFTDLYGSPIVLGLWALFFLNLVLVMADRSRSLARRVRLPVEGALPDPSSMHWHRSLDLRGDGLQLAQAAFEGSGYRVIRGGSALYAVRHRLSPVATLVFHLSFLLVLIGGITSVATRFSATALLAEGESFDGRTGPYIAPPSARRFARPPEVRFRVGEVTSVAEGPTPVDITARIEEAGGRVFDARVNRPFKADHTRFVVLDLGVAPLLVLEDSDGREVDGAFVKMLLGRDGPEPFTLGSVPMGAEFFQDFAEDGGRPFSRSMEFRNPVLLLTVPGAGEGGSPAVRPLRQGETIRLNFGTVTFRELRYAVKFFVRRERGVGFVYAGFFVACAALVARLFFYRREYALRETRGPEGPRVEVGGRSEFYRALFEEEFDRMVAKLVARGVGTPAPPEGGGGR